MRRLIPVILSASVALAGCKGSQGEEGAQGPAGKTGDAGKMGTPGAAGKDGMDGKDGKDGTTFVLSERAKRGLDIAPFPIDTAGKTSADLERIGAGSYLVNAVGNCDGCHDMQQPTMYLGGGAAFPVDDAGHKVYARNLTPDPTTGLKLKEDEFIEAMRTGKDFTNAGQQLIVMPWLYFRWMSTEDLKSIYAYLRATPPVSHTVPADDKGPFANLPPVPFPDTYTDGDAARKLPSETDYLGMPAPDPDNMLRGLAIRPLDAPAAADFARLSAAEQGRVGRGSYLANAVAYCNDCHTNPPRDFDPTSPTFLKIATADYLTGGTVFPVDPGLAPMIKQSRTMSANLTGKGHGFFNQPATDFTTFVGLITSGLHVEDPVPTPLGWPMPWDHFRRMTLDDIEAIYAYVKTVPPISGAADKDTQMLARYCAANTDCQAGETCALGTVLGQNECVGMDCGDDSMCGACQHCTDGKCAAPSMSDPSDVACATTGI